MYVDCGHNNKKVMIIIMAISLSHYSAVYIQVDTYKKAIIKAAKLYDSKKVYGLFFQKTLSGTM